MNRDRHPASQLDPRAPDPVPPAPAARRIDALFRAQAARTPEAAAVRFAGRAWTYGELDQRSDRIAARLLAAGSGPEERVAVCLERTPTLVAALLGVLKAGSAYVPLDPAYPAERLAFMLADSGARLALAESATAGVLPAFDGEVVRLGGEEEADEAPAAPPSPPCTTPDQLAYVIYTSGSTGRPKGVAIPHAPVAALLAWARGVYSQEELAGVMAATSVCFDLSVFELFLPLTSGGAVVMARDALELPRLADAGRVTLVNSVPSAINELLRGEGLPQSVVTVNLAGEPLARPLVERIYAASVAAGAASVRRVLNLYGPSEDTTYSTWSEVERGADLPVTIGLPVTGTRAWVTDRRLRPAGVGVPGELLLGGAGLARGYLGRPALTAERWVPDPFAAEGGEPGGRLYRTGDLVRRREDGRLDFLGRIDHQVKIRGFRIELGEVEAALLRRPAVHEAVAMARGEALEERSLVAYWAPAPVDDGGDGEADDAPPTEGELKEALAGELPGYMVPTRILRLEVLPRTPNGKVDRNRLPAPEAMRPEGAAPYRQPEGALERELAGWWAELLGLERAGADDGLFELGGHSLVATQIAARVRQVHGVDLPPVEVFEYPTPARLAARVEELASGGSAERPAAPASPTPPPLGTVGRDRKLPLSFPQEQIWLILQLAPQMLAYNFQFTIRLFGDLDREALVRTLAEIIRRHEIYRTTFPEVDGEPVQRIHPPWVPELPVADLSALPADRREEAAERAVTRGVNRPFDVTELPLLEWTLLRLDAEDHMLLQVEQHFVHDGWSIAVFVHELTAIYSDLAAGRPSSLPEPPIQFADFAVWQRDWLSGETLARELEAWHGRLGDPPPPLELPTDRPRPRHQSFRGDRFDADLPPDLYAAVRSFGRREGYTLFMTMLAAFEAMLYRYSGRSHFLLGSGVANRRLRELEGLLGMVVNTLVLSADLSGRPTFRQVLARARAEALFMQAHQDLPFEALVAELAPDRDLSRNPLFQHLFSFHDAPVPDIRMGGLPGEIRGELLERRNGSAKADWNVIVRPRAEQRVGRAASADDMLRVLWEFSTDLYDRSTIGRAWGHYQQILRGAIESPDRRVGELPLLTAAERDQIAAWSVARETPPWPGSVIEAVLAGAAGTEALVAVIDADGTPSTYGDLDRRSAALARRLGDAGVRPGGLVAVCLPPSAALAVALLAARRVGAAYLPLDPEHPAERRSFSLLDAGADAVVTTGELAAELPEEVRARLMAVLDVAAGPAAESPASQSTAAARLPLSAEPEARAYVIYTSGTTGRPKGTELTQRGLANLVAWHLRSYPLAAGDRVTLVASPAFDASVWELWPALAAGATVCVPPAEVKAEPVRLAAWLAEQRIAVAFLPTPLAEEVLSVISSGAEGAPPLRALLTGGDRLHRVPEGLPFPVVNHYGPTEATVVTTAGEAAPGLEGPPIGRPIDGFSVQLLDGALRPVPTGVPGELWVAGAGLARGYLRRPALTADRFRPDPLSAQPGRRMYRSGDLARWLPSGEIDFLGRADDQVQVRGVRVEPAEVEAVLEEHPGVRRAAVVPSPAGDRLVAFWLAAPQSSPAAAEPPSAAELSRHASRQLPEAAVPAGFERLDELPLAATGKVDRAALTRRAGELGAAAGAGSGTGREAGERVAPRTALESAVAEVWKEVLEVPEVGAHDDFFRHLGGHSLLAARTVARLRRTFGVDLALAEIFDRPTPAEMAVLVGERMGSPGGAVEPIPEADRSRLLPLSFGQERLWLVDRLIADRSTYTIARVWELAGRLDEAALRAAVADLALRHEALRTRFPAAEDTGSEESDGGPVQEIAPPGEGPPLLVADLTALPPARRRAESERLSAAWARTPFDLGAGPLTRLAVLRLDARDHRLLLAQHHAISDAWSLRLLLSGLGRAYEARSSGRAPNLPAPPVQPADVAVWQRRRLSGQRLEELLAWWRQALDGMPRRLDLPTDRPRPAVQRHRGARVVAPLPPEALAALDELGSRAAATPFMTLLAAWSVVLARWSGQREVVIGSPVAARERPETEGLLGFFINTLALPVRLGGAPGRGEASFSELVERVRSTSLGAFAHAELPFERLVDKLTESRDLSGSPLFQVTLALQNAGRTRLALSGLAVEPLALDRREAHFDLTLFAEERGGEGEEERILEMVWSYDRDLFDASTVERMAGHLATLLTAAVAEPTASVLDLSLMAAAERRQVMADYQVAEGAAGSAATAAPRRIDERFRDQVARTPQAPAVRFAGRAWTYAELDRRSDAIAARLVASGAGPEQRVAVCLERTPSLIAALLGVLKSGAAYVPLDPAYPAERLAFMLADSAARWALAEDATVERLPPFDGEVVRLAAHDDATDGAETPDAPPPDPVTPVPATPVPATPDQLAYVIYTSGSTGRPKGVAIPHAPVSALLDWAGDVFSPTELAGVMAATSVCFDLSVFELFLPLTSGGAVVLARDALELPRLADAERVTLVNTVPSAIDELLHAEGLPRSVVTVSLAGEPLARTLVERIYTSAAHGGGSPRRVLNLYGPSEDTTYSTWSEVERGADLPVTVGRPVTGSRALVVDRALRPAALGVPGELLLGGAGLARGYLGRPALTAERWVPDPFCGAGADAGARLYRTGDLVRRLDDGRLDFLGRLDHQVKLRGFRIELGEIEAALLRQPAVGEVVAVVRGEGADRLLVAYWARPAGARGERAEEELAEALSRELPGYMVPGRIVRLDALPRTPNGKLDRAALPAPERSAGSGFVAPRTPTEERIAALWAEALGLDRVGAEDDFFALGGNSLLANRLMARLRREVGAELHLRNLFLHPTVAGLAAEVDRTVAQDGAAGGSRAALTIRRVSRAGRRRAVDELSGGENR